MQDALARLHDYWTARGCLTVQPFNTEVGAGTMNPNTLLRVLGPEPWNVAYVEPSVRPDDSRYGENPQRLQTFTQFQVILKPEPGDPQELYLQSLEALGIDLHAHDVRFVEDNWAQPAIGAWGLGWEVWLDGMEITQFTYFQQVGGQNLDPVPVELTYGIERILMALQGVKHFKDIQYAPGVTYGEAFGQSEYEMSRYYLDEADVTTNQTLYDAYVAEAQRMVDAGLPVPAHTYVLKSSHAFNVLDARGAVSTTERANAFATMRRLARDVARLWVERREELGFPLGNVAGEAALTRASSADAGAAGTSDAAPVASKAAAPADLAVEIGVEELPPHVQPQAVEQVRESLTAALAATRLEHGEITVDGTPRRIVAYVKDVAGFEPDAEKLAKGPKVAAAFDADGNPTKALQGFARGQGVDVSAVEQVEIEGAMHVAVRKAEPGRPASQILPGIVESLVKGLRADKNMRWNDPALAYSRAIRWVVALHGDEVVPARIGAMTAGRTTYTLRLDEDPHPQVGNGVELVGTLLDRGILFRTDERRQAVVDQAVALAEKEGGVIDLEGEAAVIDEVTGLVEAPHALVVRFDERYLDLPEQILTSVMRKHQRYIPVRDASGRLKPFVVAVANGPCDDEVVSAGNANVLRARYEDALFFYNADLQVPLADHAAGLEKLTFENRLGSMAQRAARLRDVASALAGRVELTADEQQTLARAGELAKFDLASQMVVEMSSLAGFMAREYATKAGEPEAVATALYEMEQPHTAADAVPATMPGALLALADRLDLVAAMFALGAKPTGSSDPFGLRRACLGIVRILTDLSGPGGRLSGVSLREALGLAGERLRRQGIEVSEESLDAAAEFATGRYGVMLRDEGVSADLANAVLPGAATPGAAAATLTEAQSFKGDATFRAVVEFVQRITRIVPAGTEPLLDAGHLVDPAEKALLAAAQGVEPAADLASMVERMGPLVQPVATFFDETLVMVEDPAVKAARLGLLAHVRDLAPQGIDWVGLHTWLGA